MYISRFWRCHLPILLFILAAPLPLAAAARSPAAIKAAYSASIAHLDQICNWQFCHDRELRRAWALAGEWLASYLDSHPEASAADLAKSLADLDPHSATPDDSVTSLQSEALDLGQGDFLVSLQVFETGTFFVVGRSRNGGSRVKWSIDAYAGSFAAPSSLRCWKIDAECGPLYPQIVSLPSTGSGQPRFYVAAGYAGNGMTIGAQTSVWVWTGTAARPLAVIQYAEMIDDGRQIRLDGQDLIVPIKEETEGFSTSAAGADPKGVWKLRLTAAGARDLGHHWTDPELHWLDRLLAAVQGGRDTRDLAAPEVVRHLKSQIEEARGMLMDWSVDRGPATILHVSLLDGLIGSFTLVRRGGALYATAVTIDGDESGPPG